MVTGWSNICIVLSQEYGDLKGRKKTGDMADRKNSLNIHDIYQLNMLCFMGEVHGTLKQINNKIKGQ
jgi:hypothetical protein